MEGGEKKSKYEGKMKHHVSNRGHRGKNEAVAQKNKYSSLE